MSSADWLAFDDCTSTKKDHNSYATIILCWTPTPEKGWRVVLLSNTNVKKWSPCRTSAAHENKRVLVSAVVVRDEHATASAESGAVPQRLYIATPRRLYSKATRGFATGSKNKQFHLLSPPPLSPHKVHSDMRDNTAHSWGERHTSNISFKKGYVPAPAIVRTAWTTGLIFLSDRMAENIFIFLANSA